MFFLNNVDVENVDKVASSLKELIQGGDLVVLKGEIGAGKTTLVAELSKLLGCETIATSPTFAIVAEYKLIQPIKNISKIIHVDTYRLNSLNELFDLGYETFVDPASVTFIEWGDRIADFLTESYFQIEITERESSSRDYSLELIGDFSDQRIKEVIAKLEQHEWLQK
jgi:tRNA threonylcarbamoyladenosine biosynthesis protein TsaE